MPDEGVNPHEPHAAVVHVLDWFWKLNDERNMGQSGPMRLQSHQVLSFLRLEGVAIEGWEIEALRGLDRAAIEEHYRKD